jgi:hypothetical protein
MSEREHVVRTIKDGLRKIGELQEKIDKHNTQITERSVEVGTALKTLKAQMPKGIKWERYLKECGIEIRRSRADQLIRIAEGRTTVEEERADTAERVAKSRAELPIRIGEEEPEASAEAMKSKLAAADTENSFLDDDGNFAPVDPAADAACRIRGFLYRAQQSVLGARADNLKGLVCTREMLEAAKDAAKAWAEVCNLMEDADGDDDLQEAKANRPARRRGRKPKFQEMSLGDAVNTAFTDLADLASDCREVVDNAPEGLNATQRIQTLDETANVLEGLEEPAFSAELADIKVSLPKPRMPRSRGDRRDIALGIMAACIEALDSIGEDDRRNQAACDLRDALESTSTDAEMCEFPGMYQ